jgi:cupin superfamily acireductone dioxygenase involved in methionine salvage
MLIDKNNIELIKNNKICLIKNFVSLDKKYDFNFISDLLEKNQLKVVNKTFVGDLKDVFQIKSVSNTVDELKVFFDFLSKLFNYERDSKDEVDLFFSIVSQVGDAHVDTEDVFILGLSGLVLYRIYEEQNKDYYLEKGDMIFIPKGLKHKVIGINPRIIASIGFYGKRIN